MLNDYSTNIGPLLTVTGTFKFFLNTSQNDFLQECFQNRDLTTPRNLFHQYQNVSVAVPQCVDVHTNVSGCKPCVCVRTSVCVSVCVSIRVCYRRVARQGQVIIRKKSCGEMRSWRDRGAKKREREEKVKEGRDDGREAEEEKRPTTEEE